MNSCELTASITALANAIACRLSDEDLGLVAAAAAQLGDTLGTISIQRARCKAIRERSASSSTAADNVQHDR